MIAKRITADFENKTVEGIGAIKIAYPTSGGYKHGLGSELQWKAGLDDALFMSRRGGSGRGRALDTHTLAKRIDAPFVVVDNRTGEIVVSGEAGDHLVMSVTGKYDYGGVNGGTPKSGWYNSGLKLRVVKSGSEEAVALDKAAKKAVRA